jgi:GWxTD domain-containing protein
VALLAFAAAMPAHAGVQKLEGPPPWRLGGRTGFSLDAAARPDSSGLVLEVCLRVPPATLALLSRDERGFAQLQADVKVKGRFGARTASVSHQYSIDPAEAAEGQGKVIVMRFPAAPGACQVTAVLTDLVSRRPGLLHGKDDHESSALAGEMDVPRPQEGKDLSHLTFLWPFADTTAGAAFERGGRNAVPNPDRLYGLFANELRAAFTARTRAGDTRPWHWVARVYDAKGEGVAQRESTVTVDSGRLLEGEVAFDLSGEAAGGYDLELKLWQEGDAAALLRRQRFSIGWKAETWLRSAAEANDEVHFLLLADAEESFARMHPGEQEAYLDEFWRLRDPTPTTAFNEALETFRTRIRYANVVFTRPGMDRGMFSDMGRVYIRYGEPFEILKQVVPAGESTLERQLQQIINSEDRQPTDVAQKGLGGDMRPFEVWIYEGDIPLPFDADPNASKRGPSKRRILFLFVDDQGTGLYRLRYSTE